MPPRGVIDVWQVPTGPSRDRGRAALRRILCSYVGGEPAALAFERGPHGKPSLAGHRLEFSFSRSGRVAFVAVSGAGPVGVDVERMKPGRPVERIARRLAPDEAAALADAAPAERPAALHRCWTGKEAYVKGLGTGLAHGLSSFSVAPLARGRERCSVGAWDIVRAPAPAGYAAAVAAPGSGWRVRTRMLGELDG